MKKVGRKSETGTSSQKREKEATGEEKVKNTTASANASDGIGTVASKARKSKVSIPDKLSPTRVNRSSSTSVTYGKKVEAVTIVDIVTDRVIDKLCRLDLAGGSPEVVALAGACRSPAAHTIGIVHKNESQVPLIDLKLNSVVMMTLVAKRPTPGRKSQSFRGMVYLNTNDVRLSEEVDLLLSHWEEERRKMSGGRKSVGDIDDPAEDEDEDGQGKRVKDVTSDTDLAGSVSNGHHPTAAAALSDSDSNSNSNEDSDVSLKESGHTKDGVTAKRESFPSDDQEVANPGSDERDGTTTSDARKAVVQRSDPRGRKVGSSINCKTLESLESRMMGRVSHLKQLMECNGYDYSCSQVIDQTEMARVTHGIALIAFQRLIVLSRVKTDEDLHYGLEKGTIH